MKALIGEYQCKLDAKGRFLLPAGLRKQFPENEQDQFVMNRGIEPCLVLHPQKVWDQMIEKIFSRNQFIEKNRRFARRFTNGSTEIELDGNARILIPKRLMEYAGLTKDIILVAQYDKVEIWDLDRYEQWLDFDDDDFGSLAEEVMGEGVSVTPQAVASSQPAVEKPAVPPAKPAPEQPKPDDDANHDAAASQD